MTRRTLAQYQAQRIESVAEWHRRVASPQVTDGQDSSVRYLLLWTTFNALYNLLDMPKRKLRKPDEETGSPRLVHRGERAKLDGVAKLLAQDNVFLAGLLDQHIAFLQDLAQRFPGVSQPDAADDIHYSAKGEEFCFHLKQARGVASLDNRVILDDGHKVFEYSTLTEPITQKAVLAKPERFMRELVFVLYQIRNNVAHGGSAAFFRRGNKVADGAIAVLSSIVQSLLEHRGLLVESAAPAAGLVE